MNTNTPHRSSAPFDLRNFRRSRAVLADNTRVAPRRHGNSARRSRTTAEAFTPRRQASSAASCTCAAPANSQLRSDHANVSAAAREQAVRPNPFSDLGAQSASVKVDKWKEGDNDSLEAILRNQGYSVQEIYRRDDNGHSLVDRVSSANNLRDPNLIHPGQDLVVPRKDERAPETTSTGSSALDLFQELRQQRTELAPADNTRTNTPRLGQSIRPSDYPSIERLLPATPLLDSVLGS